MANQAEVVTERTFTPGDLRTLADVTRAVANGTLMSNELQVMLNERKVTQETMPIWISFVPNFGGVITLRCWEKRPSENSEDFFLRSPVAIENLDPRFSGKMEVMSQSEKWMLEAGARLKRHLPCTDIRLNLADGTNGDGFSFQCWAV